MHRFSAIRHCGEQRARVARASTFLNASAAKPGSFASLVDLGRSWLPSSLRHFGAVYTDDLEQSTALAACGCLPHSVSFIGDLTALIGEGYGQIKCRRATRVPASGNDNRRSRGRTTRYRSRRGSRAWASSCAVISAGRVPSKSPGPSPRRSAPAPVPSAPWSSAASAPRC